MAEFLERLIGNPELVTFLIAMVPVVELRGAIPVGVGMGLGPFRAMLLAVLGNMVPVPFIILFIRRVFDWMRRHMPKLEGVVSRLEAKAESKRELIVRWSTLGLVILVAIPLPGTGAWTGALVAALLDIRLKKSFPAIFLGVLIAGLLVTGITYGFTAAF
jgi:uncharacterized membrane protein